jgi:PAS domain S-box-containing protein
MLGVVILQAASGRKLSLKEQELANKLLQTQIIFDSLSEGIVVLDRNRNIVQINQSARKMLGLMDSNLSRTELAATFQVGLPNGDPLPPESWPSALALRGEFLQNCELNITRSDHTKSIIGEISTAPVLGPDGQLLQIIVSYRDVTKPREIDEARLRLAAIVESSEDAIIGKDGRGIVKSWNGGAEKLFGYTAQEMIGTSVRQLLPLDRLEEEEDILARIERGETVDHIETVRRRKNGQFINVSLTISPIRDSSGKIVGASKIARNITEKKMMESRLFLSQKMEAIGQLTGGIAHDFNNLLGVIIGNLDLLERRLAADEISLKRVHTAQKAATRGAELTRRMLAFSSREQLHPKPIPIEDPVQATIELATRGLGPEIEIVTHFDRGIPPVMVDAGGLENALLNILVNARDAMPNGGQITITTQRALLGKEHGKIEFDGVEPGHYATITISDSGEGMTREILERAFEPFYTTKLPGKGTGIGLATVYGFFKQSGGTVHLYSEPGYGTTVSCYLPLADSENIPPQENIPVALPEAETGHETILLVDDEVDLLEIASTYLHDLGYIVLCATSGSEALALVDRHPEIDLLVTDVIMPGGMNGAELAQEACSRLQKLRVVYASGFPADALADRNMSMANGPLLRKPYQRSELVSLIRTTLSHKLATSQNSASSVV